jgi:hypothetical protein
MPRKPNNDDKRIAHISDVLDRVRRVQDDTAQLIKSLEAARGPEPAPPKRPRKKR